MTFDLWHRLAGLALVAAPGGTTLIHRAVYNASRNGPPLAIEMGLCLVTMMLASMGVMLLIHGRRLFDRSSTIDAKSEKPRVDLNNRLFAPSDPISRAYDTRRGVALMQAYTGLSQVHRLRQSHRHRTDGTQVSARARSRRQY